MRRGTPRPPPTDLAARSLEDRLVAVHGEFWRISHEQAPLLDWSDNGEARFSRPGLSCKVLYLARTKETAFWERFGEELRDQPPDLRALSAKVLAERVWKTCRVDSARAFRCLDLRKSKTLRRLGADGATFFAPYTITQSWSAALMAHPAKLDGLVYTSRLDMPETCLALFSRPHLTATPGPFTVTPSPVRLLDDPELLALLVREKIALIRQADDSAPAIFAPQSENRRGSFNT